MVTIQTSYSRCDATENQGLLYRRLIDNAVVVDELADDDTPTAAKDYAWRRAPGGDHRQAEDDLPTAAKDCRDELQKGITISYMVVRLDRVGSSQQLPNWRSVDAPNILVTRREKEALVQLLSDQSAIRPLLTKQRPNMSTHAAEEASVFSSCLVPGCSD